MAVTIVGTLEMIWTSGADTISDGLDISMASPTEQPLTLNTTLVFTDPAVDVRDTLEAYLATTFGMTSITRVGTPRAGALYEWTAVMAGITRQIVLWQMAPLRQVGVELGQTVAGDTGTTARGYQSVEIGDGASAAGKQSVAIGADASVAETAEYATAVGWKASVGMNADNATAVGYEATVADGATDALAFGTDATASGVSSVAMGTRANASGTDSLAIGTDSQSALTSTAMGVNAGATGSNSTSLGRAASASGASSFAAGDTAVASGSDASAVGTDAQATGGLTTAFGTRAVASGPGAMAFGVDANAVGSYSMALGYNARTLSGETAVVEFFAEKIRAVSRNVVGTIIPIASTLQLADTTGTLHTIGVDATKGLMYDGFMVKSKRGRNVQNLTVTRTSNIDIDFTTANASVTGLVPGATYDLDISMYLWMSTVSAGSFRPIIKLTTGGAEMIAPITNAVAGIHDHSWGMVDTRVADGTGTITVHPAVRWNSGSITSSRAEIILRVEPA